MIERAPMSTTTTSATAPTVAVQLAKIVITLAITVAMVIALGAWVLWAFNPVGDEWDCSPGEFPATNEAGGSSCFENGSELPTGWRADPQGNQPID